MHFVVAFREQLKLNELHSDHISVRIHSFKVLGEVVAKPKEVFCFTERDHESWREIGCDGARIGPSDDRGLESICSELSSLLEP